MKSWKKNALDAAGFVWSVGRGVHANASDAICLKEYWDEKAEIKSRSVTFTKRCRDCYKETQLLILQISFLLSKKAQTCANSNPRKSFHKTFTFKNCHGD
jgi:hypothetical protein